MGDTMTMEQTAWLFTKDQESVRLELRDDAEGVQLVIDGPGEATSRFDFPPGTAVDSFRREITSTSCSPMATTAGSVRTSRSDVP